MPHRMTSEVQRLHRWTSEPVGLSNYPFTQPVPRLYVALPAGA